METFLPRPQWKLNAEQLKNIIEALVFMWNQRATASFQTHHLMVTFISYREKNMAMRMATPVDEVSYVVVAGPLTKQSSSSSLIIIFLRLLGKMRS